MSAEMQPQPVVFFPPALDPKQRVSNMDFRPLPMPIEEKVEKESDDSDPKDLSAQESVPSSASDQSPSNTPSLPQVPAMIAPAVKETTNNKVSAPSGQTS